ncbi:MAG: hypothetical protein ABIN89_01280 [Chitinophagaceae bacterium]
MILAAELRIGNLLDYNTHSFIVTSLSKNKVEAEPLGDATNAASAKIKLEYVTLSEEWMKLLAGNETGYLTISSLERSSNSSDLITLSTIECYLHEDGFLRVCAYEYDKQPNGSTNISDDVITLGYSHITFVHQLQNLYFDLSGKELPLPLPDREIPSN